MEKIAFISGGTFIYWSSIILALAVVTAVCFYAATYLARGGNTTGMALAVPMIALLGIVLGRFVHWYSRTDAYASFGEAMTNFASGGFALMGAFWAALITVGVLRLLRLIPSAGKMLDALAIGGGAGIVVGRLGSLFNTSDRGVALPETVGFPFAAPVVNDVSGLVENRLATFMIQSMVTAVIVVALVVFMLVSHLRKKRIKDGDVCLLFLLAYGALQIGFREIRVCDGKLPPVPDIRFQCRLFVRSLRSLVDRKHEMNIRMDQFRHLSAGRALTARITVMRIAAVEILKVSQSQRQGTAPLILIHEHGMSHSPAVSHRREYLRYRSISYDISKPHPTLSFLL